MKLLVIVLCLLSERFLVHGSSYNRFSWFTDYCNIIVKQLNEKARLSHPILLLVFAVLPLLVIAGLALYVFNSFLFGFVTLLFNLVVFFYCIGPDNPFYPGREKVSEDITLDDAGRYLAQVNGQLFAVIFWYIAMGPLAILAYRLISLCQEQDAVAQYAIRITSVLDWIPAKITALLYLLAGNFQAGFRHFTKMFFTAPANNQTMLSVCGLHAVGCDEPNQTLMPQAEMLVEHAVIMLLVLLAFFTMAAWM